MTEQEVQEALRAAATEVLETMFFVCLDEGVESAEQPPESAPAVKITFRGQPSGQMRLQLTASAARSIAADFLGADQDSVAERQVSEVLREMANMICGAVLSRVESAAVFRLDEPVLLEADQQAVAPAAVSLQMPLSNGTLSLTMCLEGAECLRVA